MTGRTVPVWTGSTVPLLTGTTVPVRRRALWRAGYVFRIIRILRDGVAQILQLRSPHEQVNVRLAQPTLFDSDQ
ncbi:MAG: hypothetical protein EHM79_21165, partial [Geobacter sp.]